MRSRNFHSMNFPQIWYKDPFGVPDMNFNKKVGVTHYIMWISHIEMCTKKFRVGYQTNFPVIQLHVSRTFRADTNDYSLVTLLMCNKDVH